MILTIKKFNSSFCDDLLYQYNETYNCSNNTKSLSPISTISSCCLEGINFIYRKIMNSSDNIQNQNQNQNSLCNNNYYEYYGNYIGNNSNYYNISCSNTSNGGGNGGNGGNGSNGGNGGSGNGNGNGNDKMEKTLFIIIMYSVCLCFCLFPLVLKMVDKTKQKIYENRIKKYYNYNDIDSNRMTIQNPCFGMDMDMDIDIDIDKTLIHIQ